MKVKFKKTSLDARLPEYKTAGAAGADVYVLGGFMIRPGETVRADTGMLIEIEEGYEVQVRPRSGLAIKHGITIINAPGTIDCDYRGALLIALINHGDEEFYIKRSTRVAQLVVAPVVRAEFEFVDELSETERGEGGFGSTGE